MKLMKKRECLSCGSSLAGRSDKKYCDDSCRSVYHNRQRQMHESCKRKTDSILRQNRKILFQAIHEKGGARLNRHQLLSSGFRPDFVTRIASGPDGSMIRCYYEFGLRRVSEMEVEIFRLADSDYRRQSARRKFA